MSMKYIILICFFLIVNISFGQTNWHVAVDGDDLIGDGTELNPFSSIDHAAKQANPGDTVFVHEGTYRNSDFNDGNIWEGKNLAKITVNGEEGNYITFKPFPNEKVLLEFDGTYGVLFSNASYIIFEGFEVKGISDSITQDKANDAWGLYINKDDGLIYNLEDEIGINYPNPSPYKRGDKIPKEPKNLTKPSYFSGKGIVASKSHHIIIRNNIVRDTPGSGIRSNGSDYVTISNNEVYNCTFYTTAGSGAVTVAEATVIPEGDLFKGPKIILEKNYVHHNENRMVSFASSKSFLNFVIDEGTGLFLTRNSTYEHGYIQVSNNISAYNGASGIVCHFTNRANIEHNTLYKNGTTNDSAAGGIGINNADDVSVKNNISYAEPDHWALGILANPVTNLVIESNILYNENGEENIERNLGSYSNGWSEINPLLQDPVSGNYNLTSNSPAIDASNTVQSLTDDILGNGRIDGLSDIGAYEDSNRSAHDMIKKMGRGINLGNVFSAPVEGNWSAKATEQYFLDVADAGFTNVRIPMDFYGNRTTGNTSAYSTESSTANNYNGTITDYIVDLNYLDRIEQVINWSLNAGLVTVLDFHGATLKNEFIHTFNSSKNEFTHPSSAKRAADNHKFRAIWTTIAERFKNYSENLIFEVINEPYFDLGADDMNVLNSDIINIIRNTGDNNTTRFIIITGGGKNAYEAPLQINPSILESDSNLIATFHYYLPRDFTVSSRENKNDFVWGSDTDKNEIDNHFSEVQNWAKSVNTPILVGEFGADNENGFKYSTGKYGDFGGPEDASREEYHHYVAELAIESGFAFAAWDAGNDSNKTINKRSDHSSVINYYSNGTVDSSKWVENVKNALLGIGFDDDGDGISNDKDLCPNTTAGTEVDENGCGLQTLSADNFKIIITGETCKSSNNGIVSISANETLNYRATLNGEGVHEIYEFNENVDITDLSSGSYELCISIENQADYNQCFRFSIIEPEELSVSSKINVKDKKVELSLGGGKEYTINLNGAILTTTSSQISLELTSNQNSLKVNTDKNCQGEYFETIYLLNEIIVYPNPASEIISVRSNEEIKNIELFNQLGQKIRLEKNVLEGNSIQLNLTKLPKGLYILRVNELTKPIIKN